MRKLLIVLLIIGTATAWSHLASAFEEVGDRPSRHLEVEVWLNKHNGAVYKPGQHVRAYFQTSEDCYVVVYNVDTEGFVHVLYPKYNDRAWVAAGIIYEIPDPYDDYDLIVDSPTGIEYVVAVASHYPLDVQALHDLGEDVESDIYWPMGRITGDPHLAIQEINQQLVWGDGDHDPEGYSSDISWFYVRRWVPYPRYIVYHWYPHYYYEPWWDPYVHANIFLDFYWDHYWCRSWWWCRGCRPIYVYWYIDRDSGRRYTWKGHYYRDRRKPDWYREKPVRRDGGGGRPAKPGDETGTAAWEQRRRPSPSGPSQPAEVIKEKASTPNRRTRTDVINENREKSIRERKSRDGSTPTDRAKASKKQTRMEMRPSRESEKSRDETLNREKKSSERVTKSVKKSSRRSSGLSKVIGSVAKFFSGGSKKEKSRSQKSSQDSGSKQQSSSSQRSSKQSSKESSSREEQSRRRK